MFKTNRNRRPVWGEVHPAPAKKKSIRNRSGWKNDEKWKRFLISILGNRVYDWFFLEMLCAYMKFLRLYVLGQFGLGFKHSFHHRPCTLNFWQNKMLTLLVQYFGFSRIDRHIGIDCTTSSRISIISKVCPPLQAIWRESKRVKSSFGFVGRHCEMVNCVQLPLIFSPSSETSAPFAGVK